MSGSGRILGGGRHRGAVAAGLLLLCGVLALSACGGSSPASKPKTLAVLQQAQAALKDATGTFTYASSAKSLKLSGTGTTKLTANPQRSLTVMEINGQSTTTIVDGLDTTYTQLPAGASQGDSQVQWLKSGSVNAVVQGVSDVLDYAGYTDATQQADTTIENVPVFHVTGVEPSGNTVDLYLSKDTHLPVEAVIHHSDASAIDITVSYTATNTGLTISLPPESTVLSQ
jgi:outer membrane lipoprotein-sorting protein